jgi:hypothetical protein
MSPGNVCSPGELHARPQGLHVRREDPTFAGRTATFARRTSTFAKDTARDRSGRLFGSVLLGFLPFFFCHAEVQDSTN